uniref:Mohawk homeobox a n=1 Tax=Fundulus heteroclitus TaxID=8078 RepID=A0A3Q2Q985_FUNHE
MNTVVFNQPSSQILFKEKANEVEMSSRSYLEVIDGQHPDLLCSSAAIRESQAVRHRRSGGSKVRHKRQALQDMARPLKQWLYKHRDNPYPTKMEKILLALGSQMTLVQVSNWFANARRRLKNTVRQPDLSWALRIKLYNKYVQGNAERLSVSSDDSCSEGRPPICALRKAVVALRSGCLASKCRFPISCPLKLASLLSSGLLCFHWSDNYPLLKLYMLDLAAVYRKIMLKWCCEG